MHLPQIVADSKYRRKIAEEVFSPEASGCVHRYSALKYSWDLCVGRP